MTLTGTGPQTPGYHPMHHTGRTGHELLRTGTVLGATHLTHCSAQHLVVTPSRSVEGGEGLR
jgi:hypothetical protein